jgi:hypothetical protein
MRLTVGFRTAAAANPCTRPCGGWRRRHRRGDGISSRITSASGSSVVPLPGICRRASRSKDARGTVRELLSHSDSGPLHLPSESAPSHSLAGREPGWLLACTFTDGEHRARSSLLCDIRDSHYLTNPVVALHWPYASQGHPASIPHAAERRRHGEH